MQALNSNFIEEKYKVVIYRILYTVDLAMLFDAVLFAKC